MKRYISAAALLLVAIGAAAQNLNPTVEVTNTFEGKLVDMHKPLQEMAVPDSLTRFDLSFDYSIFDNPYKGVYEFKPYFVDMTPQPDGYNGNKLYLRLGAGYPLQPTFDLVWSPLYQGPFTLNVYASHNSFFGSYRNIVTNRKDGRVLLQADRDAGEYELTPSAVKGFDMLNRAGVNGLWEWNAGGLRFDVGYYGLYNKLYDKSLYNAADISLSVSAKDRGGTYMYYDASTALRFASDAVEGLNALSTRDIAFRGTFGPVLQTHNRLLIDLGLDLAIYRGLMQASLGDFYFTPRYVLKYRGINLSAGVKFAIPIHDGTDPFGEVLNSRKGQLAYPDIHADFTFWRDHLNLYLDVTGGEDINSYSSLKEYNHFFNANFGRGAAPLTDLTVERVNARIGLRGKIVNDLRFDLSGGWRMLGNGMIESVCTGGTKTGGLPDYLVPSVGWGAYNMAYADLFLVYDGKPVMVEGKMSWKWTNILDKELGGFAPSPLSGFLRVTYNHRDRIKAGINMNAALGRSGIVTPISSGAAAAVVKVPGYVDLGLFSQFALNRHLSLWIEGGNLLNMTIQHIPMFPSTGIWGRAGITLVF